MFSILFVVSALYAGLSSSKKAAQVVATAVPFGLWKNNQELKQNMKVGINTEYEEYKKTQKDSTEEAFELFKFEESALPPSLHFLVSQKWILTEMELFSLFAMVRRHMLESGEGPYAQQMQTLCVKYSMSYEELTSHARLLASEVDYKKFIWLSNNRMADKRIGQILMQNG